MLDRSAGISRARGHGFTREDGEAAVRVVEPPGLSEYIAAAARAEESMISSSCG